MDQTLVLHHADPRGFRQGAFLEDLGNAKTLAVLVGEAHLTLKQITKLAQV